MIIKDLDTMEKIVSKNSDLKWVGWDVLDPEGHPHHRHREGGR